MPDPAEGDRLVAELIQDLQRLHAQAGCPSLRSMSVIAHYSHTSLAAVLAGGRLPSLNLMLGFVRACGGDERSWRLRWTEVRARLDRAAPYVGGAGGRTPAGVAAKARDAVPAPDAGAASGLGGVCPRRVPAQVPHAVSGFAGRAAELAWLTALLVGRECAGADSPMMIAAITGPPGVGKTALAIQFAHQVADQFPDGQLWLDLHGYGPGDARAPMLPGHALSSILRSLGVPPHNIPVGLDELAAEYRTCLAGKRLLVILDNATDEDQVRPLLPGHRDNAVLVTSRCALSGLAARDGAYPLILDVLPPPDALALIRHIVGEQRATAEPAACADIARMCGCLPLALRVAAQRAARRTHVPLTAVAAELDAGLRRLDLLSAGTGETTSARAVFDWSYRTLPRETARVFRLAGLHRGPDISTGAAAALAGIEPARTRGLLDALVSAHLLEETAQDRYRMHDLLRLYAAERAQAEETGPDRDAALTRMVTWYLHAAHTGHNALAPQLARAPVDAVGRPPHLPDISTDEQALAWFEIERANLVIAVSHAAELNQPLIASRLAISMSIFFNLRKYWTDWQDTHLVGLAAARESGDRLSEAWILESTAIRCWGLREFRESLSGFRQALQIYQEFGVRSHEGAVLAGIGNAHHGLGNLESAADYLRQSLTVCAESGYSWGLGIAMTSLSNVYRDLGQFGEALDCFREALPICRTLGARWVEGAALSHLADTYADMGDYLESVDHHQQALIILRQIGDLRGEARSLHKIGDAYARMCRYGEAIGYYRQALDIRRKISHPHGEAQTLSKLATALSKEGDHEAATDARQQSARIYNALGASGPDT